MELLEYAGHYLEAKKKLTEIHELLNKRRFKEAAGLIDQTIVELRLMRQAVKTYVKD
jgi:hypothetical protein